MLKKKFDIENILRIFVAFIANQFQSKVKAILTDNAKEFCQGDLQQFCTEQGILQHKSCTYTPQQNGVVERKHRHLLETARALSFQSRLPLQ